MKCVPSLNLVYTEEEEYVTADVAEAKSLVSFLVASLCLALPFFCIFFCFFLPRPSVRPCVRVLGGHGTPVVLGPASLCVCRRPASLGPRLTDG